MAHKLGSVDASLEATTMELGLELLDSNWLFNDVAFVHKTINNKISCSKFLKKINFKP